MAGEITKTAVVHLCVENQIKQVNVGKKCSNAEDLCILLCRMLEIKPVTRHLFALRLHNQPQIWLTPNMDLEKLDDLEFDFRVRFRIASFRRLKDIDRKAFNYLFHQMKGDIMCNKISEVSYDKHRRDLMGMGVTDMYRFMIEKEVSRESVENDYKKFIPPELVKKHTFFIRKPVRESLQKIEKCGKKDADYVKSVYVRQFEEMAPNYLTEEFKSITDEGGVGYKINITVNPFHKNYPGIWICMETRKEMKELCSIEGLCHIAVRDDATVEVSRRNGIPIYLKFASNAFMFSFVGLLDGYYRLVSKWTFNLCLDIATPTLKKLHLMKCHGPVGGEFSYAKLEEKRSCKPGCYILRESESHYDTYYIDICAAGSSKTKPKTYKIEKTASDQFQFSFDQAFYPSIEKLIAQYKSEGKLFTLEDCVPPSEFDQSPLLLCQPESQAFASLSSVDVELGAPQCINPRTIQVFKAEKRNQIDGICTVYRCNLKLSKNKRTEAAMQVLKPEFYDQYLKEFLNLTNQWAFLSSSAIVKFYGITLSNPVSMVMEYLKLGPLDVYLREKRTTIMLVDLVEASTCLATALWHMEESGMVHGNIRCHKLFVASHNSNTFSVKLTDPGMHQYSDKDVHWLPVECYPNPKLAKTSIAADVWAFGTTLWEIFSYGQQPPEVDDAISVKKFYKCNKRLPAPEECPSEIFRIMLESWDVDLHSRKNPQGLMRDIHQINYQVFNSRRNHSYATVFPQAFQEKAETVSIANVSLSTSSSSLVSGATDTTLLDETKLAGTIGLSNPGLQISCDQLSLNNSLDISWQPGDNSYFDICNENMDLSHGLGMFDCVYELDGQYNVVLQGKIGSGCYGDVYRGLIEGLIEDDQEKKEIQVAIKRLKGNAIAACRYDFEREINIMKSLKHPNIVQIIGVIREGEISLVMEFVQHGSLQSYLQIYKQTLTPKQLLKFSLDVAKGMEYLGSKNIVHRDLAARNILVASEDHVKISDFGLAQVLEKNNYYILKTQRKLPIKWYAPESLRDGKFSLSTDVWSYGVTLYEIFSFGEDPKLGDWSAEDETQQLLLSTLESGIRLPCPNLCNQEYYVHLMKPCWNWDSHQRPTFSMLVVILQKLIANE